MRSSRSTGGTRPSSERVLRPLRTVTRIPGLRLLVGSLFASLPDLLDVLTLFSFFLLFFGVVGVELLAGVGERLAQFLERGHGERAAGDGCEELSSGSRRSSRNLRLQRRFVRNSESTSADSQLVLAPDRCTGATI